MLGLLTLPNSPILGADTPPNGNQGTPGMNNTSANGTPGWQTYQDPRFGFRVATPTGWALHADEHAIHLWNQDGSTFVLVIPFQSAPERSGQGSGSEDAALIAGVSGTHQQLFPQASAPRITPAPPQGGDSVGEFDYQSAYGPGLARILCSRRSGGGGMLFVIAAPTVRFETEKPTLLQILGSLNFGASNTPPPTTVSGGPPDQAATEKAIQEAAARMQWTQWSDPRERAFTVEVPQGWQIDGGMFRFGNTDTRRAVQARSPEDDAVVQLGDPNLTSFEIPTPMMFQMGLREGQRNNPTGNFQTTIAQFMPASVFNRWYVANFLAAEVEGAQVGQEQNMPELSRQQTMQMQQSGLQGQVDVANAEFSGRSRRTGKPVSGVVMSMVTRFPPGPMGGGMWAVNPVWCVTTAGDAGAESRKAVAMAALLHLMNSWHDDPAWVARENQTQAQISAQMQQTNAEVSQRTHEMAMDNIRAAGERSRIIAKGSDDRRNASMSAFHNRQAALDNVHRQQVNYLGDRTDVRDPGTGQAWNVGSGSNHYYHDAHSDTIIGTDSAYSPGVDWKPLDQY